MAKTLVHKTNTVESITVNGTLDFNDGDISVTGESGETVNIVALFEGLDGEEVVISLRKKEEETIEILD